MTKAEEALKKHKEKMVEMFPFTEEKLGEEEFEHLIEVSFMEGWNAREKSEP